MVVTRIREKYSGWSKTRLALYFAVLAIFCLFCFSNFAFSARSFYNLVHIGISVILAVGIFIYILVYSEFRFDSLTFLIVLFILLVGCSSLINGKIGDFPTSVVLNGILAIAIYQLSKEESVFNTLMVLFVVGGIGFCINYLWHYRSEILSFTFLRTTDRLGGFFDNENGVAKNLGLITVAGVYIVLKNKWWLFTLAPFASAILLVTTGSFSGLLTTALVVISMLYLFLKKKGRLVFSVVLVGFVVVIALMLQLPQMEYFRNRLVAIFITLLPGSNVVADNSSDGRLQFALDALLVWSTNPLFGYGPGTVMEYTTGGYAHNNFAELLADYGLFAFLVFESIVLIPFVRSIRRKADRDDFVGIAGITFFVFFFQMFLVTFYTKTEYILFALLFGATSSVHDPRLVVSFSGKRLNVLFRRHGMVVKNRIFIE